MDSIEDRPVENAAIAAVRRRVEHCWPQFVMLSLGRPYDHHAQYISVLRTEELPPVGYRARYGTSPFGSQAKLELGHLSISWLRELFACTGEYSAIPV